MPHHTHHPLVYVLLLWISILSIIQVAFITFYLTAGHHSVHQNNSVTALGLMKHKAPTPSISPEDKLPLRPGKMLSFQAARDDKVEKIKWVSNNPDTTPVTVKEDLIINKDGHYFLNLQVTLNDSCKERHTIRLFVDENIILQGQINTESCSTGILSKVWGLRAQQKLKVTVEPVAFINKTEFLTHLDMIYIPLAWS